MLSLSIPEFLPEALWNERASELLPGGPRLRLAKLPISERVRRQVSGAHRARTCAFPSQCQALCLPQVLPEAAKQGFRLVNPFPGWPRRGRPGVPGAERLVRVDPDLDGTDGFFIALLERSGDEGAGVQGLHEPAALGAPGKQGRTGSTANDRAEEGGCRGPVPAGSEPAPRVKATHPKLEAGGPAAMV